jgi:hypothetical protein
MKSEKKRWRPSPALVTLTTALVVIAVTMLLGWFNARRYRVNARVEIAEPVTSPENSASPASTIASTLPDGEVARTAERIREATGLLMGLTVLAVTEQMSDRIPTKVEALLNLMAERDLLSPGVNQTLIKGALTSDRATIYVRYRSVPFGVEVVSVGREKIDGPAVIARLVTGGADDSGAALFVAKKIEGVTAPRPFASLTEIAALNWSVESLRERSFNPQEIDQLNCGETVFLSRFVARLGARVERAGDER